MGRLSREVVVDEAMRLLDEAGVDGVSTRRLAQRLGVEQPALYWHFRNKAALLAAMAEAAMAHHAQAPLPEAEPWQTWFAGNFHRFREALLRYRDGARLHAGSHPGETDKSRIQRKLSFLVAAGFQEHDARMAMLGAGRYTVGCVLEEQAEAALLEVEDLAAHGEVHAAAFADGLGFFIGGMAVKLR